MFGRTVTHLMKLYAFIHLLMQTFACCAVCGMEGCIVAVCTASTSYFAVTVRTGETSVDDYLLQPLAVLSLEISDKGIVSLPFRELIFLEIRTHVTQK